MLMAKDKYFSFFSCSPAVGEQQRKHKTELKNTCRTKINKCDTRQKATHTPISEKRSGTVNAYDSSNG